MAEPEWKWWIGDGERYHTSCDTREEALQIALEDYGGNCTIVEAVQSSPKLSDYFDVHRFIEDAEERAWEDFGDPENDSLIFDLGQKQILELEEFMKGILDAWQLMRSLTFTGYIFSQTRNEEFIPPSGSQP